MLKVSQLSGFGSGAQAGDPDIASRYLAIDFRNGATDYHGNVVSVRGAGETLTAAGLVMPGNTNNGADISFVPKYGTYTNWPCFPGAQDSCEEYFVTAESGGSTNVKALYGISFTGGSGNISKMAVMNSATLIGAITLSTDGSYQSANEVVSAGSAFPINTRVHVATTKQGNVHRMFVNGVKIIEFTATGAPFATNFGPTIGFSGFNQNMKGTFESIRCYLGIAKYTANFTPPASLII